ncbi:MULTISPECIES: methyltransferase [Metallosphaera]|uniref:Methyltransferase n=1 Tax=Metallosphaera cuprina (strain Ar-4) TaxID=1006006 RepID=F4FY84_METCR|nr:methyltransferase [Metallosphaera cuprina]AEB95457.1 methyltransferase [Metallosphaera cuprina Ar-4]
MKCLKVPRRKLGELKGVEVHPGYNIIFDGEYALIPVSNFQGELVECNPLPKERTPRLNELIPGLSSFYKVGDILIISPKREIRGEELDLILKTYRAKSLFIRKKVKGEFRVNELIHVAGENRTTTIFSESGIKYFVDVSKVYVNPSMATERLRIVNEIDRGKVLDVFTGYGALAIPLSKKLGYAVAGDINLDGLLMALKSVHLNSSKILLDLVQYDGKYLPFRDKAFDLAVGDNPTAIDDFVNEICRVSLKAVIYKLGKLDAGWERVNDYSKDLFIMKRFLRCDN